MHERWIYRTEITEQERNTFIAAIGDNSLNYTPISVADLGISRYRFIVHMTVTPWLPTEFYIIEIYNPPAGNAYITRKILIDIDL